MQPLILLSTLILAVMGGPLGRRVSNHDSVTVTAAADPTDWWPIEPMTGIVDSVDVEAGNPPGAIVTAGGVDSFAATENADGKPAAEPLVTWSTGPCNSKLEVCSTPTGAPATNAADSSAITATPDAASNTLPELDLRQILSPNLPSIALSLPHGTTSSASTSCNGTAF